MYQDRIREARRRRRWQLPVVKLLGPLIVLWYGGNYAVRGTDLSPFFCGETCTLAKRVLDRLGTYCRGWGKFDLAPLVL